MLNDSSIAQLERMLQRAEEDVSRLREERSHWIAQCERDGFDLVEAARLYDEEREQVLNAYEE